jgi:phage host-nuclease inhibitor protein Gam
MQMTSKNPFQIRSEVLELAKEYMDKQTAMNIEYAEKMQALGKIQVEDYTKAFKPYTFDDLMNKAKEMYSFVSSKDK